MTKIIYLTIDTQKAKVISTLTILTVFQRAVLEFTPLYVIIGRQVWQELPNIQTFPSTHTVWKFQSTYISEQILELPFETL